ncbi:hypothetical protein M0804_003564 [Polistes exclamans]|nr:hypothetical protein M0804_003564 [Polistes exclamans]
MPDNVCSCEQTLRKDCYGGGGGGGSGSGGRKQNLGFMKNVFLDEKASKLLVLVLLVLLLTLLMLIQLTSP